MIRTLAGVLLLTAIGCAHMSRQSSPIEADRQFSALSVSNGAAAAFAAYMADDALSLPAGAEPITGKQGIVESMAPLSAGRLSWTPQQEAISRSGELGYTWGLYEYRSPKGVSFGKYVTIWRKQPDGSWKAIVDIGNQSPSPK